MNKYRRVAVHLSPRLLFLRDIEVVMYGVGFSLAPTKHVDFLEAASLKLAGKGVIYDLASPKGAVRITYGGGPC